MSKEDVEKFTHLMQVAFAISESAYEAKMHSEEAEAHADDVDRDAVNAWNDVYKLVKATVQSNKWAARSDLGKGITYGSDIGNLEE